MTLDWSFAVAVQIDDVFTMIVCVNFMVKSVELRIVIQVGYCCEPNIDGFDGQIGDEDRKYGR